MFEDFFTLGGVSYIMAFVTLLVFGLFVGVVLVMLNDTARRYFRKAAYPLLVVTVAVFIVVEIAILQVPHRSYEQGYQDGVGRPDANCPVFLTDAEGNLVVSEDGASHVKHEYRLVGRPVVLTLDGEIHLWLANRNVFDDGTHLCSLTLTTRNGQFAEEATNAWDDLHGEPESGAELRELREQAEAQGEGEGEPGEGNEGSPGNSGSQSGAPQDVVITLPSEQSDGSADDGEGEDEPGDMQNDQQSYGSVSIEPYDDQPQEK
mgnify:CR=1 FL=1